MNYKELINCDLKRIGGGEFSRLLFNHSFMVCYWFRIGSYLEQHKGYAKIFFPIVKLLYKQIAFKTGIQLPFSTKISEGLKFVHFGSIVITRHAIIGRNCSIMQGVTIGRTDKGAPIIGDNVTICANAVVIGPITIGNNVIIGAGSVVVKSVPSNSIVAGNPASIIRENNEVKMVF